MPDLDRPQFIVDIDHKPEGESPLWLMDADGSHLGQIMTDYCRQHGLLDWTGDGYDEIILPNARGIFNHKGQRIFTFNTGKPGSAVLFGDMTGDKISDITIVTTEPLQAFIFENKNGSPSEEELGCGVNYTFY